MATSYCLNFFLKQWLKISSKFKKQNTWIIIHSLKAINCQILPLSMKQTIYSRHTCIKNQSLAFWHLKNSNTLNLTFSVLTVVVSLVPILNGLNLQIIKKIHCNDYFVFLYINLYVKKFQLKVIWISSNKFFHVTAIFSLLKLTVAQSTLSFDIIYISWLRWEQSQGFSWTIF